jgi:predicted membrane chloride channel (bestrophin family)
VATPEPARRPIGFSYLLLLAAFVFAVIVALVLLWPLGSVTVLTGLGLLAIVLALYLGSRLLS